MQFDEANEEEGMEGKPTKKCVEVKVSLLVSGACGYFCVQVHVESGSGPSLRDIVISVTAALPLTTHPSHFVIPEVSSTQRKQPLVVTVVCTPSLLPTNTCLQLSATYRTSDGNLPYLCLLYHAVFDRYSANC